MRLDITEFEEKRTEVVHVPKLEIEKSSTVTKHVHNILCIPDLHQPFELEGFIEFCVALYYKYHCTDVVFIGDIIDNHHSSFHIPNSSGMGVSNELTKAIELMRPWYEAFPDAYVTMGNHDRIPKRQANAAGLDTRWISAISDVFQVPGWNFVDHIIIDGIYFTHGAKRHAVPNALKKGMPVVQGHFHQHCYVNHITQKTWAMQLGIGFDKTKYGFEYAQETIDDWVVCCGVIMDGVPILHKFDGGDV